MNKLIVRAFPVLPGKESQMREFARAMETSKAAEAVLFFGRHGVTRESWHLQTTPHGLWAIGVSQLTNIAVEDVAKGYSESQEPFDRWFKDQVKEITGIDPDEAPLGPPTECVYDTGGKG